MGESGIWLRAICAGGCGDGPLPCSPVRIVYSYDTAIPDTGADTEQVVNTVAALARHGESLTLLVPGVRAGSGDASLIRDYYHVQGDFDIEQLRRGAGPRLFQKWSHALHAPQHPAVAAADLAYTRNLPGAWCLLRAGRRVAYEHFRPWGDQIPPLQPALRAILRHPNLVAAVFHSQHTLASYHRLGVPDDRMLVAHNGWDPARMEPRLSVAEARAKLGLAPERQTAVYTGRLNLRKGLDVILAAARLAPEIAFVLVGSEGEGPVEVSARALGNVKVVAWRPFAELAPWLYAADVLLIPPSLAPLERHGNTVLPLKLFQYLAAGRVVLAPRAPDTAELLSDGENAVIVPPGDAAELVATLRRLAAAPELARRLAEGARRSAEGLTWDARAGRIMAFLQQRLAAPASRPGPDPWRAPAWLRETARWALWLS